MTCSGAGTGDFYSIKHIGYNNVLNGVYYNIHKLGNIK